MVFSSYVRDEPCTRCGRAVTVRLIAQVGVSGVQSLPIPQEQHADSSAYGGVDGACRRAL